MPIRSDDIMLNMALWFNPVGSHLQETATTVAMTLSPPDGADKLRMQVSGAGTIRYTLDGTPPTTAKGFVLMSNYGPLIIPIDSDTVVVVKSISDSTNSTVEYQWGGLNRA